jgi:roadblock/LC7 domain-containing protein
MQTKMNQASNEEKVVKKNKIESFDISRSDETMHLAVDLAKFIKENRLYQNIQGKEYVNVEGWQYAGSRLGILPVVDALTNMSDSTEIKYMAKVNLLNLRTEQIVGAGFALCSNKEQGRKYYQEYAIASMAQTRAIGKAYRNILAWIIRAAGYEPTPAEEMDYQGNVTEQKAEQPAKSAAAPKTMKAVPADPVVAEVAPAPVQAPAAPAPVAEEATVKYATAKQKEEIIRLLNNPVITRQEKTKMLLNINKLDEERAKQSIAKLKKVIEDREQEQSAAA